MSTVRTAKKLLLGREIAHMLDATGTSQADAARLIETSQPRIASLINGGGNISPGDLVLLAEKLGFTDPGYQEALRELRRDNHKRGFWSTGYNRAYSEDVRLLVDLERYADQIRWMECEVVPGLLQCEAYVSAMYADEPERLGLTLEDLVRSRLARQEILGKDDPPAMQFVLSESCLRRMCGDAGVMLEQIGYMIELSNRRNVMIQVMPFDSPLGRRASISRGFTLIRLPSPGVAGPLELAFVEHVGEVRYLDDRKALDEHESAWARLTSAALSFQDSREFMLKVAGELGEFKDENESP